MVQIGGTMRGRRRKPKLRIAFFGTPAEIERLARIAREYETRTLPGGTVSRAVAARAAMLVGLDTIERDFGLPPMEPPPNKQATRGPSRSDEEPASETRPTRKHPQSGIVYKR